MKKNKTKKDGEMSPKELLKDTSFVLKFLFKTNRKIYYVRIPTILLDVISTFIPVVFIRLILNSITENKGLTNSLAYVAVMAGMTFLTSILKKICNIYDDRQVNLTRQLADLALGKSVTRVEYSDLERPETKSFVGLAGEDSIIYILTLVSNFVTSLIKVIGLSAMVLTFEPIIMVLIAAVVVAKRIIDKKKHMRLVKYRNTWSPLNRKTNYIYDSMKDNTFAKEVRINGLTDWLSGKLNDYIDSTMIPLLKRQGKENLKLDTFTTITTSLQELAVYLILAHGVVFKALSIGGFSMYMASINQFTSSISAVFWNYSRLIIMSRFAREFRYCIQLKERKELSDTFNRIDEEKLRSVSVEFKNVTFKYPGTENNVLDDFSLFIPAGSSLSIVGINGAGKTTIIKLLCRLYQPDRGEILVNGIPINNIPSDQFYNLLAVVFQDFNLFPFSVRENISLRTVSDEEKVISSAKKSGIFEKVSGLARGFDTSVYKEFDDEGIEFSGGEGQKLAIARAYYKDSPIIILDEPTSALDPIAEYEIYSHFHDLTSGKSTIYISHRLSSTRFTDKIAVLHHGKLIEYGNHEDLIKIKDGVYSNMYEKQARYYV